MKFESLLEFSNWLNLTEASYTDKDIPDYFYVAIKFSEDLVRPKPYTPQGAVCSLVGLEGISDKVSILQSFWSSNQCGLQMPARAVLALNKVSKVNYENPDYLSSAGFRASRRLQSGSGGPEAEKSSKYKQSAVFNTVIGKFLSMLSSKLPGLTGGAYITNDKNKLLTATDIVERLKRVSPTKGGLRGKFVSDQRVWGQTKKAEDGGLTGKNIKPIRSRHFENNLKNIRNITDLANRLISVLHDVPGYEKLLNKTDFIIKDDDGNVKKESHMPIIIGCLQQAALDVFSGYSGEREWVMKRESMMSTGKICPECNKFVGVDSSKVNKLINCPFCNGEILATNLQKEVIHKPVLHVPEGSVLYLGNPDSYSLLPWAKKEFAQWRSDDIANNPNKQHSDAEGNEYKVLVNKYKLYNKFEVHFVNTGEEASKEAAENKKKPYDPENSSIRQKVIDALKKGINKVNILTKKMEKIEGVPSSKLNSYLRRWEKLGILSIHGNDIKLIDSSIDEEIMIVYNLIRKDESASDYTIKKQAVIEQEELDRCLNYLLKQGKIQKNVDDTWSIKLSDEEMNTITQDESDVLDVIKKHQIRDASSLSSYIKKSLDFKFILRKLKLKQKIFTSPLTRRYVVTDTSDEPLNSKEKFVLEILKQWPNSDLASLKQEVISSVNDEDNPDGDNLNKMKLDELVSILDKFIAKGMISYNSANEEIKLKSHHELPHVTKWSKIGQKILDMASHHYVTSIQEIADMLGIDYYILSNSYDKLISSKFLKTEDGSNRLLTDSSLKTEDTEEGKKVLEHLNKNKHASVSELNQLFKNNNYYYNSTDDLVDDLKKSNFLDITYNPIEDESLVHLKSKSLNLDLSSYEEKILKILSDANKAITTHTISDQYNNHEETSITSTGTKHILDSLVKNEKIKHTKNILGKDIWYSLTVPPPKDLNYYSNFILNILNEHDFMQLDSLEKIVKEKTNNELDDNYEIRKVLEFLEQEKKIARTYHTVTGQYYYHLSNKNFNSEEKDNEIKNVIVALLQHQALSTERIRIELINHGFNLSGNSTENLLGLLNSEGKINKQKSLTGKSWSVEEIKIPTPEDEKMIIGAINTFPHGVVDLRSLYSKLSNNGHGYISSNNAKDVIDKMIEIGKLYVYIINPDEYWASFISLTSWQGKKNPLEEMILDYLKKATFPVTGDNIQQGINYYTDVRKALESLEKQNIIKKVNTSYYWSDSTYELASHAPLGHEIVPQVPVPQVPVPQVPVKQNPITFDLNPTTTSEWISFKFF